MFAKNCSLECCWVVLRPNHSIRSNWIIMLPHPFRVCKVPEVLASVCLLHSFTIYSYREYPEIWWTFWGTAQAGTHRHRKFSWFKQLGLLLYLERAAGDNRHGRGFRAGRRASSPSQNSGAGARPFLRGGLSADAGGTTAWRMARVIS